MSDDRAVMIQDLPEEERPRERLAKFGAEALSNAELLAILLRVGVKGESAIDLAQRLLSELGGLSGLAKARLPELARLRGFGLAKGAQLQAAMELGRRLAAASETSKVQIRCASEVARYVASWMRYYDQERLVALLLDTRSQVLQKIEVSVGTLSGSPAHPREVFKEVLAYSAHSLILVHNHPSGDPTPSRDDILLTERMVKVGELMGVPVLDHVIIGDGRHVSLKESGRM